MANNSSDTTTAPVKIFSRLDPCGCGCKGRDSQHAATFTRTLSDVRERDGHARVRPGWRVNFNATAIARINGSTELVVREYMNSVRNPGERITLGWSRVDGGWTRCADGSLDWVAAPGSLVYGETKPERRVA